MSDTWSTVKSTIGTVAPAIATAIGTPLIGKAVQGICGILGLSPEAKPMEVRNAFNNATAAQLIEIEKFNAEIDLENRKLELEETKLHKEDRESARKREMELTKQGKKDYTQSILIGLQFVTFFAILACLSFDNNLKDTAINVLEVASGYIMANLANAMRYYFGSSEKKG